MRFYFYFFLGITFISTAQKKEKGDISGTVIDSVYNSPIEDATLRVDNWTNAVSNAAGYFELKSCILPCKIIISKVGYQKKIILLDSILKKNLVFLLKPLQLEEVIIKATPQVVNDNGRVSIPIEKINSIPQIGGEKDLIRALLIIPGAQPGNEAQSSFQMRGGSNDQNLIILDGVPIYNQGHFLNFLSIFNTESIGAVDLYKSNFSPEYGGRLSSVLNIKQREGGQKLKGSATIGILTSKIFLEGPIGKHGGSFISSIRNSNLGFLTLEKRSQYLKKNVQNADFFFFNLSDFSTKVSFPINKNSKISFNAYFSSDLINNGDKTSNTNNFTSTIFNNSLYSANYYNAISDKLDFDVVVGYTINQLKNKNSAINFKRIRNDVLTWNGRDSVLFTNTTFEPIDTIKIVSTSVVKDFIFTNSWRLAVNANLKINAGLFYSRRNYLPSITEGRSDNNEKIIADEFSTYVQAIQEFGQLKISGGLRASGFYNNTTYLNAEPRLNLNYQINRNANLSLGYERMIQYSHALLPGVDFMDRMVWVPSTTDFKPELADQLSLGFYFSNKNSKSSFSAETYYKKLQNQVYFLGSAGEFNRISNWQKYTLNNGNGKAYGLELGYQKNYEKLALQLGYTHSYAFRQFKEFNKSEYFPFIFDRRHNFNTTAVYTPNKKWNFNAMFLFLTGRRVNIPDQQTVTNFYFPSLELTSNFYNFKLPATHRLDLSVDYNTVSKNGRDVVWNFSLYNAYNHKNYYAAKITSSDSEIKGDIVNRKIIYKSLLPIIPSFTYTIKF